MGQLTAPEAVRTGQHGTSIVIMMIALILSKITGQLREILAPIDGFEALNAFIQGLIPDFGRNFIGGSIQCALVPTLQVLWVQTRNGRLA